MGGDPGVLLLKVAQELSDCGTSNVRYLECDPKSGHPCDVAFVMTAGGLTIHTYDVGPDAKYSMVYFDEEQTEELQKFLGVVNRGQ